MKGKLVAAAASNGGNQTDLLVCFPSRAHLALMPKPICSPSRPAELPKWHHHRHHHQHHSRHQHGATATTKPVSTKRNAGSCSSRRKNSSPLFKAKARDRDVEEELDEPTSPRITCAGQIRVRPSTKARSSNASSSRPSTEGKNWMSVMEEIERMRKDGKKKPGGGSWLEAIGIKKDALQMFSSFHGLRFNMGCFGSFPGSIDCTSDDDEEEEDEGISVVREDVREVSGSNSNDVFSKWFMLIEENHDMDFKEEIKHNDDEHDEEEEDNENEEEKENMQNSAIPPPNALLLMRCRSAPAKGLINRAEQLETEETKNVNKALRDQEDHQKAKEENEKLVVMRCAPDFFKVSMDIAKETWVVGGELDLLARSRSCRR